MSRYTPDRLRNVVFAGHADAGKTSLVEALLHQAGAINRLGSVTAGSTVTDFEPEERTKQHSFYTAVAHAAWKDLELNLIDTPGYPDFFAETACAFAAADIAVIVVNARAGIGLGTRKAWKLAEARGLARMIVINKLDSDNVELDALVDALQDAFGKRCVWFRRPDGTGARYGGNADALAPGSDLREAIVEAAVETDERLLEKYLEQGAISEDELAAGILAGCKAGALVPMVATSATKELGVADVLEVLSRYMPGPLDATRRKGVKGEVVSPEGPFLAQVFKVAIGAHGTLNYVRVLAGEAMAHTNILNLSHADAKEERTHDFQRPQGKATEPMDKLVAGDVAIIPKLETLHAGDTITIAGGSRVVLPRFEVPEPMVALAVTPKTRADETKLRPALDRLQREDLAFQTARNEETHELIVRGMSLLHLETVLHRMKERTHVEVAHHTPKIAYRETIRGKGDARYRHKKQSGGSGEFGEVALRVMPAERGEGFVFENAVVGGAISGSFIPAIEKGIQDAMQEGVVAGYRVVDVKVEVYDGKEHPVDSKEVAFKKAGRGAFRQAMESARPTLLEPIMLVDITVPEQYTGDIMGDLARRRSQPQGMDQGEDGTVIRALVPEAEMQTYSQDLRSMTSGEGVFTMKFDHYELLPPDKAHPLIEHWKKTKTHEE